MYIKKINIEKLGPVDDFAIEPSFDEKGNPVPVVLVGQNGAGKSLTLAVILDAITEARRASFTEIKEVGSTDYIRLSSKNYVRKDGGYSYVHATISSDSAKLIFDEVVSRLSYEEFEEVAGHLTHLPNLSQGDFKNSGFHKHVSHADAYKNDIKNLMFLYFPYFRYEHAYWMNEKANVDFVKEHNFYGHSKMNPIRTNIIDDTKRWILNVLLDREIYERQVRSSNIPERGLVNEFLGYAGPNTQLFAMINQLLTAMFKAKDPEVISARVGIGPKGSREISVFIQKEGGKEESIAPDIGQLSSGELMTLGLATEIIRAYELVSGKTPGSLNDVFGIVLIDEVDLHLHISFQKTVLPLIIRQFPKVQFVMTTHSPFFLLGMAETGKIDIYNLPIGNKISPDEFTEFQASYEIFVQENEQFQSRYNYLHEKMQQNGRPLIITEGKTDWRHMQFALSVFKSSGEYKDLDVEFLEFSSDVDMGETKLSQMCEYMATLPQQRKTIFVFDHDNSQIIKKMSSESDSFKDWGNQVFSLCLPIPSHRAEYKNVSIEFYYTDDALRTFDPSSKKRLWFTNEIEIITSPTNGQKRYRALSEPNDAEEFDKKVFDQPADKIVDEDGNYVGLSKSAFAEVIAGNPEISKDFERGAFKLLFDIFREILVQDSLANKKCES